MFHILEDYYLKYTSQSLNPSHQLLTSHADAVTNEKNYLIFILVIILLRHISKMERKKRMKGKAIFLLILVLFLGTGYLINYQREKTKKENTRIITTEMGDEFIITTNDDLHRKTRLRNEKSNFSCRINYYNPDDNILLLCDTENVTIYSLCSTKFCKVKKYDTYISLQSYNEDNADIYHYLSEIIEKDKAASIFLKDYLNNLKDDRVNVK